MDSLKQVKWGILGCSRIAREKMIPSIQKSRNMTVTAIASTKAECRNYYKTIANIDRQYSNYSDLLEDQLIDAIYISLPNSLHCEWTIKAAEHGKHVLCEKPAGIDQEHVFKMIDACNKNNVLFLEGFMYRFHPQHQRVKAIIEKGMIGETKLIRSTFSYPYDSNRHSDIKLNKSLGGGCLLDVGCYCVNVSRWIFNLEPNTVIAHACSSKEYGVDLSTFGMLQFPENKIAIFDCSFEMFRRNTYEVIGTEGKIYVQSGFTPSGKTDIELYDNQGKRKIETFNKVDQYAEELDFFSKSIFQRRIFTESNSDSYNNACVLSALRLSMETKKISYLKDF